MASASEVAERFGANLRVARRRAGLTQEELSYRAGLHRTEIAHLECGKREPRISTLVEQRRVLALARQAAEFASEEAEVLLVERIGCGLRE